MRIAFLGTPEPAAASLRALLDAGHDVRLAVTRPDRPSGRSRAPVPPAVAVAARELGIDVFQPTRVRDAAFRERLAACDPDALVVVAYGRILPRPVLELAPRGAINVHFSLLPAYRGAAPVQWALARGETVTGVTTLRMNERMDEGDVLLRREVAIEPGEHAPELTARLARVGAELIVETLDRIGDLVPVPQDPGGATVAPILTRDDGRIDPSWTAAEIAGRVRGFDPWPGAWIVTGGRRLRIADARPLDGGAATGPPGTLSELLPDGVVLDCGGKTRLLLTRVQPEGRRVMGARDAVHGRQLAIGARVERPSS